jgi:hypothetical protein
MKTFPLRPSGMMAHYLAHPACRSAGWTEMQNGMAVAVNDLAYEVLSWLAEGNSVFRPREATREAEEGFRGLVHLLGQLRLRAGLTI